MKTIVASIILSVFFVSCATSYKEKSNARVKILMPQITEYIDGQLTKYKGKMFYSLRGIEEVSIGSKVIFKSYAINQKKDVYCASRSCWVDVSYIIYYKGKEYSKKDRFDLEYLGAEEKLILKTKYKTGGTYKNDAKTGKFFIQKNLSFNDPFEYYYTRYKEYVKKVKKRSISIGMPEELMIISWGKPDKVNKTVGSWGVNKQNIYSGYYVYTKNGIITSWQNK